MFLSYVGRAAALVVGVSAFVVGCAGVPDEGTGTEDFPVPVDAPVEPTRANDDVWTTTKVCEACGCTVSGFQCNCGANPSQKKLECIKNGGPTKVFSATLFSAP